MFYLFFMTKSIFVPDLITTLIRWPLLKSVFTCSMSLHGSHNDFCAFSTILLLNLGCKVKFELIYGNEIPDFLPVMHYYVR